MARERTNRRVLLVEDDDGIAEMVAVALEVEGLGVTRVSDGPSALIAVHDADVMILDWMLPGLDGISVLEAVRSSGNGIGVIMITAKGSIDDKVRALASADDYLTKPFAIEELVARVDVLLRRGDTYTPQRTVHRIGRLSVDTATREAHVDGQRVPFTPTEYKVLEQLVAHAGTAVSRADVLSEVWGYDFGGNRANLDTAVSSVRRKLAALGCDVIETVRGYGYLVREP